MKLTQPLITKFAGLLSATAIRLWMRTLDYKAVYYDRSSDPATPECQSQAIYVFWHEYMLFPIYLRGHNNLSLLLSRHRDAEILSRAAYHLGFDVVRGSTNRGGVTAIRELLRKSRSMHLAITPDGPRGPRRQFAVGPIYLSSKLGIPLVLTGFGYDRPWRMPSWDRFALPKPYSRARSIVSPRIPIPPNLDRDGLEHHRQRIERLLNQLTTEAESWAESGFSRADQWPVMRQPSPLAGRSAARRLSTVVLPLRKAA